MLENLIFEDSSASITSKKKIIDFFFTDQKLDEIKKITLYIIKCIKNISLFMTLCCYIRCSNRNKSNFKEWKRNINETKLSFCKKLTTCFTIRDITFLMMLTCHFDVEFSFSVWKNVARVSKPVLCVRRVQRRLGITIKIC